MIKLYELFVDVIVAIDDSCQDSVQHSADQVAEELLQAADLPAGHHRGAAAADQHHWRHLRAQHPWLHQEGVHTRHPTTGSHVLYN